jgi:acetyl/propionyl-CoA carboxylase alpha subunit
VPLFYDPLLAKLVVWGRDRAQAIARMRRALDEYQVIGVRTTLPFARWLMDQPRFHEADLSTDFIAEEWGTSGPATIAVADEPPDSTGDTLTPAQAAAVVGGLLLHEQTEREKLRRRPVVNGGAEVSHWREAARRDGLRRA